MPICFLSISLEIIITVMSIFFVQHQLGSLNNYIYPQAKQFVTAQACIVVCSGMHIQACTYYANYGHAHCAYTTEQQTFTMIRKEGIISVGI